MAKSNRSPLQVSPEFKRKMDDIQRSIMMAQGKKISLREITEDIIRSPLFRDIEKDMIKQGNLRMNIKIKLDRRPLG